MLDFRLHMPIYSRYYVILLFTNEELWKGQHAAFQKDLKNEKLKVIRDWHKN